MKKNAPFEMVPGDKIVGGDDGLPSMQWGLCAVFLCNHPEVGTVVVLDGTDIEGCVRIQAPTGGIIWHAHAEALRTHNGQPFKPQPRHLALIERSA